MKALEQEFELLVRRHKSTIYTVCFMFSKDSDEVDDLFQEVLINLWRGFSTFKGDSKVETWIWRVSFNTCISQERKKKRTENIPLEMGIDLFRDKDEDTRQIQMLYQRIHQLKPFDRAIVLLWLEGIPYEEIAAIVGITVKNVSVRLYRIKEELKKMSNPKS
jgi:RNA polymerase sigma-70 factor (ECF subfamily)